MRIDGLLSSNGLLRSFILVLLLFNVGCHAANGWAMNRSGMKHYKRGNYAHARHQFSKAIADDPCNADYRHNLAMALQKQGDLAGAERILRHNLTVDAMHQPTYHALAQVLVTEGRQAEAQDLIAGWAETQPYVPESNLELAWLQREVGNKAGAEQSLRNALKADPAHPTALAHLGQLYQESGRPDQAAAYYQRSLAAKWDQPEVKSRLTTIAESNSVNRMSRRSAMMQNPVAVPMMAYSEPMMVSQPMMSSQPMMVSQPMLMPQPMMASQVPYTAEPQVTMLETVQANPRARANRRNRNPAETTVVAAYPLSNYDVTTAPVTAIDPSNGQSIVFQPPVVADQTVAAPVATSNYQPTTIAAGVPPLVPQADPAHSGAADMTAGVPVVDPH